MNMKFRGVGVFSQLCFVNDFQLQFCSCFSLLFFISGFGNRGKHLINISDESVDYGCVLKSGERFSYKMLKQ